MKQKVYKYTDKKGVFFDVTNIADLEILYSEVDMDFLLSNKILDIKVNLEKYDLDTMNKLIEFSHSLPKGLQSSFIFENSKTNIRISELENFIDFEEVLKQNNVGVYFSESMDVLFTLSEVIHAQEQIENFTDNIKSLDASPYEKYLIIYDFLTSRVYKEADNNNDSRHIISILNSDNIVCVGYAKMLKRLCSEVGIECYTQGSLVYSKQTGEYLDGHENNVVKMVDEKYGIDGLFYADACWDAVDKGKEGRKTYSFSLIPLSDKDKLKKADVRITDKDFLYNGFNSILCKRNYTKIISFGFDTYAGVNQDEEVYYDQDRRKRACDRVKQIFLKNGISADIYSKVEEIPELCSLGRFLALCMEDEVDESRISEALEELGQIKQEGAEYYTDEKKLKMEFATGSGVFKGQDVIKYLDELGVEPTMKTDTRIVWNDPYTWNDIISAMDDPERLKQMGLKKEQYQIRELSSGWNSAIKSHSLILRERLIKDSLDKFIGNSQPISLQTFEQAYRSRCALAEMSNERTEWMTSNAIRNTAIRTAHKFLPSAENCFANLPPELVQDIWGAENDFDNEFGL